jgi:acetyl-CoA C-acetyltransferase
MNTDVVIVAPKRTPIGKFLGTFASCSAADLGTAAVRGVLGASGIDPSRVTEVIFGNARQAGGGPNVARQIAVRSGIPQAVPAWTVNMACASGLQTIALAVDRVRLDLAAVVVAGGTESMSGLPYLIPDARKGKKMGHFSLVDAMYRDGFLCPLCDQLMGETAETLAEEYRITREEQDRFAARSQNWCGEARREGRFRDEIVPVEVKGKSIREDEHPRDGVTEASLAGLPSVFKKGGTVHAGNSSGITDGAAAMLVMSRARCEELGLVSQAMAEVEATAAVGVDPARMGIGPVPAVRALLQKTGSALRDFGLIEINEAFAAQVLACHRELGFDMERVNVNGGAIALGHPIGASGARIVVTLLHEMRRRGARRGLATLCVSGGMGMAMSLQLCC